MSVRHHNALEPGYRLHWYRIESVLGQGGFGITYLATDTNLDQPVAIKEFLPSDLAVRTRDSEVHPVSEARRDTFGWGLTRFLTEARTLAQFRHPNIVRVYSVFEANGTAYMVMEYERGTSLEDALKFRYVEGERALLSLVHALMDGLELVHRAGFIHRDIKPDNVYLREGDGVPVLLDFGSARQAVGVETRTLTSLVTPGYAPFEQYNATRENDRQGPWTDVYSLAATLYRAITGRGPVDAVARADALLSGETDPLIPLVQLEPAGYSQRLLEAVDRGLMFQPGDRPQSLAEWRDRLPARPTMPDFTAAAARTVRAPTGGSEDETVIRDGAPTAPRTAGAPVPESTPDASGPGAPPRRRVAVTASALLLAAAGAGAWWFLGPGPEPVPQPTPPAAKRPAVPSPTAAGPDAPPPAAPAPASTAAPQPAAPAGATAPVPPLEPSVETGETARGDAATARLAADRERLERDRAALEAQRARFALEAERRAAEDARRDAEEQARRMAQERDRLEQARRRLDALRAEEEARAADAARALDDAAADAARAVEEAAGAQRAAGPAVEPASAAPVQAPVQDPVGPTPVPPPQASAPAGDPARMRELLERAAADVAALRLTSPAGNNAVERYRAVLAQDPGNARAQQGLTRVVARYLELVGNALDAGDPDRAGAMLERARGVDPQHPGLPAAADALDSARREQRARAAAQAAERERAEQERLRLQAERAAAERRAEAERAEADRAEADRAEADRDRAERDRIAAGREQARREALARERASAARAKAEADAKARADAAAARTVRIGVFPHDSIRTCFFTVGSRIDDGVRAAAVARPEVSVVYSYYTRGADTSQVGTGSRLWEGTAARKTPVVGAVQAAARAMEVDAVLMGWYHCHHSQGITEDRYRVELYLVDVRTGVTYAAERGLLATRSAVDEVLGKLYAARGL